MYSKMNTLNEAISLYRHGPNVPIEVVVSYRSLLTPAHCAAAADCHVCRGTQNRHILPKRNSKFIVKYHSVVHARLPFWTREKDCSCRPATLSIYADWPAEDRDWTLSVWLDQTTDSWITGSIAETIFILINLLDSLPVTNDGRELI